MRELLDDLDRWRTAGKRCVVGRVVGVEGSGPRDAGAAMAVNEDGEVIGSVSGGCVEGAVVAEALDMMRTGKQAKVVSFGYSDDEAFAVGLTCGGTIHVFMQEGVANTRMYDTLASRLRSNVPTAFVVVIDGPNTGASMLVSPDEATLGGLGHSELDRVAARDALGELEAARTSTRHYGTEGQTTPEDLVDSSHVQVFIESFAPPPRMVIFGAVDFTGALARVAKVLGYHVTVCDARKVFATRRRFPMADDVLVAWPDEVFAAHGASLGARDAVCILTHDPKFDVPAIQGALRSNVGYIGVMGSRKTHAKRLERLAEVGLRADDLLRVHSPIGLDIGARTPEETAISICAEIIAARTGRSAQSLSNTSGSIH